MTERYVFVKEFLKMSPMALLDRTEALLKEVNQLFIPNPLRALPVRILG